MDGRLKLILSTMLALFIFLFSSVCAAETVVHLDRDHRSARTSYETNAAKPRIVVVIAGDPHITAEERILTDIEGLLSMKFPQKEFDVFLDPNVESAMYETLEERNGIMIPGQSSGQGTGFIFKQDESSTTFQVNPAQGNSQFNRHIDFPSSGPIQFLGEQIMLDSLTKKEIAAIGEEYQYDYVLVLPIYLAYEESKETFLTIWRKTAITLRMRMIDVRQGKYLYRKDIVQMGDSGTTFPLIFGSPGFMRTARKAVNRSMLKGLNEIPLGEKIEISQEELDYGDKW